MIFQIHLRKSEREYFRPKVKGTDKRAKYQICEQEREQKKFTFYAERKQIEPMLNLFEDFRTDAGSESRVKHA